MDNAVVTKLDPNLVSAINRAVKIALDEKQDSSEKEIVEKVICRLQHDQCAQSENDEHSMFNPLAGP